MIGTFAIRVLGLGLQFALVLIIARALGGETYGRFAAGVSLAAVLSGLASFGMPNLMLRDLSRASVPGEGARLLRDHGRVGLAVLLVAFGLAAVIGPVLAADRAILLVALVLFPLLTLAQYRQSAALAFGPPSSALLPELVVAPILVLALMLFSGGLAERTLTGVLAATAIAGALATFAASKAILLRARARPTSDRRRFSTLLTNAVPFFLADFPRLVFSNADLLLVGFFLGPLATGAYSLATRVASLTSLSLFAVNVSFQRVFASSFARGDRNREADLAVAATFLAAGGGIIIAVALLVIGPHVIALAGPDLSVPPGVLATLIAAHLSNSLAGPNGMILLMSGHEKRAAAGSWIQTALLVVFAGTGAAAGSLSAAAYGVLLAMIAGNVTLSVMLFRRTGLLVHPFANAERRRLSLDFLR